MEDVYVIKVKTKPAITTLYPSERRYSASTVGGLSFVHLIFGALGLLLGIIGDSVQGIILFVCCLPPLASGIWAWKKWYIDRNITIFFYCCIFSATVSIICLISTLYDVSVFTQQIIMLTELEKSNYTLDAFTVLDLNLENSTTFENNSTVNEDDNVTDEYIRGRILLVINIVVACLMEFTWSLLSIKISLKGMKKEFSEDSQLENKKGKIKMTPSTLTSRPDIILMNKHICCSVQSLDSLQSLNVQNVCPKLPLPESNKEFKERVDKFLSNQVDHRNVSDNT